MVKLEAAFQNHIIICITYGSVASRIKSLSKRKLLHFHIAYPQLSLVFLTLSKFQGSFFISVSIFLFLVFFLKKRKLLTFLCHLHHYVMWVCFTGNCFFSYLGDYGCAFISAYVLLLYNLSSYCFSSIFL